MFLTQTKLRTTVLLTVTLVAMLTVQTYAQITVLSQSRSVSASATMDCGSTVDASSQSSTAPGVFNESVSEFQDGVEANANGGLCYFLQEFFSSSASQNTTIAGPMVQGIGQVDAGKGGGQFEIGNATASSVLSVNFQVTAPISYQLFGQVAGVDASSGGFFPGDATVSLKLGSTTIHSVSTNPPDVFGSGTENPFDFSGTLLPGTYTLSASAFGNASGPVESGDSSNFSFTFVPEPTVTPFALLTIALLGLRLKSRNGLAMLG